MSFLEQVDVLILTYDEAPNIGRTLAALSRFPEVVVLDSHSTDGTGDIVRNFPNTRLSTRRFDDHASQWSHGLRACGLHRLWVLALDADYLVPPALVDEISHLEPPAPVAGYRTTFRYCVNGTPLSGTLYTPVVVFYRRDKASYVQAGHTQRVVIDGDIADLKGQIDHDDRKPLTRWLASQQRYAKLEAEHLLRLPRTALRSTDRIRLTRWAGPILVFFYTLIWRRCIFDGWPGWFYVLQRTLAETMIALELLQKRFDSGTRANSAHDAIGERD
jgi:glycosyltransferase involved in cell wall biosynthesis